MPKPRKPAAQLAQRQAQEERPARRRGGEGVAGRVPCIRALLRRGGGHVALDMAGAQADDAVAAAGELEVVGDEDEGRAAVALQGEQEVDDRAARALVEVAGRLVGDQDRRVRRDRAGDRDALLLAARELGRVVVQPLAEADRPELASRPLEGVGGAGELQRQRDVLERRHGRARGGRTGRRCRCAGRESAPGASSSSCERSVPSTTTRPVSGRSRPAISMSSVDLPEPDGPTRPTASPRSIPSEIPLRI